MSVKLLTEHHLEFLSLKGGCIGSSESTLVKMPHCWKSPRGSYVCAPQDGSNTNDSLPMYHDMLKKGTCNFIYKHINSDIWGFENLCFAVYRNPKI